MKLKPAAVLLLLLLQFNANAQSFKPGFSIGETSFLLNGKPTVIRCGEMHFARIPKPYWRHRLQMAKAMGLNAVCAYLFWNIIEKEPGQFSWEGQADAAAFCKMAQEEGLYVLLRPGPYACAEWEMGGFPWWLLKDKTMKLRTQHPYYLERCKQYLAEVGKVLAPLQVTNGGPIIMVQVENEYGSFGKDKEYIGILRDYIKAAGFNVPLFTCDGPSQLKNDVRPDIFAVVNFGSNPQSGFKALRDMQAKGPLMCGEYYPGWFDSWGTKHHTGASDRIVKELGWMLDNKASFSIYMVHGGTTFGTFSGANAPPYAPQTSSYDYDAPVNESGEATAKFFEIRNLFAKHLQEGEVLTPVPAAIPKQNIRPFTLNEYAGVFKNLPAPFTADSIMCFEDLDLAYGAMLYETSLPAGEKTNLTVKEIHDYATVYIDNVLIGVLDRRKNTTISIPERKKATTLRIFTEAMGRVNYGANMHDRKGIHGPVTVSIGQKTVQLNSWKHYNLPMGEKNSALSFKKNTTTIKGQPGFYKGSFTTQSNADTYLDLSKWNKGLVWVNGICIGRFWNIGPTQTMFVPGCWLKKGKNEVMVFDMLGISNPILSGTTKPILDSLTEKQPTAHRKPGQQWVAPANGVQHSGVFENTIEWQTAKFNTTPQGRFVCIEALSTFDEQPYTTIAELELLDENGKEIPRSNWKIAFADSEELQGEDGKADNVFDLQSTSTWHTQWQGKSPKHPHQLVIDIGTVKKISGIKYLGRQDSRNGRIKEYRVYVY